MLRTKGLFSTTDIILHTQEHFRIDQDYFIPHGHGNDLLHNCQYHYLLISAWDSVASISRWCSFYRGHGHWPNKTQSTLFNAWRMFCFHSVSLRWRRKWKERLDSKHVGGTKLTRTCAVTSQRINPEYLVEPHPPFTAYDWDSWELCGYNLKNRFNVQ